ncbi:MAG TPA: S-layer protein [Cyanobacteria bacterium UBA11049]|nr:S-layer protein [Cyanobacteria bacterium UBA11049]
MLFSRFAARRVSLVVLLAALTACANSPNGKNIEQILAADPRVQEKSGTATADPAQQQANDPNANLPPRENAIASLPADFPTEIRYPNAQLQEVTPPTSQNNGDNNTSASAERSQRTRWVTSDPSNFVLDFYQKEFKANNWEILNQQQSDAPAATIEARRNDLQVSVSIIPTGTNTQTDATPAPTQPEAGTEFIVQYQRNTPQTASPSVPQTSNQPSPATDPRTTQNSSFTDLNSAPQELRQYITDLASLDVFQLEQTNSKSNTTEILTQFQPSKTISHREFARWIFAANNQIHANRPSLQIRAASPTAPPAFKDVPATDPDFPVIQGLAEAGLIPSSLSGDTTAVLFRPDAPLTREQLILWKVPLDTRQALANATVDAVRESWGFQDAARVDPKALRAVLADFQNGEQSNIRRAFGYTTLFQPKRPVTRAEAAAAIWYFGNASEGISAQEALKLKQQQNQPQPQPSASPQPVPSSSPQ